MGSWHVPEHPELKTACGLWILDAKTDLESLGAVLHGQFMEHGQRFQAVKDGQERFLL